MKTIRDHKWVPVSAAVLLPLLAFAAGQSSPSYHVEADVRCGANANVGAGSASFQLSHSVAQFSVVAPLNISATYTVEPGYQPQTDGFDSDGDGTPDTADADTDGDGTPDTADATPYDYDDDGRNNVTDPDDDGDQLADVIECEVGTSPLNPNTDGDPHNDYEEWIAGTGGDDSNSFFAVTQFELTGADTVTVEWQGVSGRTYTLGSATNLLDGTNVVWSTQATTNVTVDGTATLDTSATAGPRFYRLTVEQTP